MNDWGNGGQGVIGGLLGRTRECIRYQSYDHSESPSDSMGTVVQNTRLGTSLEHLIEL